jgi:hypothetical protein
LFATVAGGVALGAVDLLLQKVLPYPWANLANSSAIWALAAYGLGLWVRTPWWRAAGAGAVLLVLAVPVYYLAAAIFLHDELAVVWQPVAVQWMAFGAVAGAVFGFGASLAGSSGWQQLVGIGLPGAVLFAEALASGLRGGDVGYRHDQRQAALIELALGVLVILLVGRTARQRIGGLLVSMPLALIGFMAFKLGGF